MLVVVTPWVDLRDASSLHACVASSGPSSVGALGAGAGAGDGTGFADGPVGVDPDPEPEDDEFPPLHAKIASAASVHTLKCFASPIDIRPILSLEWREIHFGEVYERSRPVIARLAELIGPSQKWHVSPRAKSSTIRSEILW
jgi:hypothetical protein